MAALWQPLKAGDTVRIIAPGAKIPNAVEDLHKCCDFLRGLDLNPVYSKNIFADPREAAVTYYNFANTDLKRAEDFADALQSNAQAIWCFRGGYGSDRVLAHLFANSVTQPAQPKLFIGFSDITNFHSYLNTQLQWPTLHAASVRQLALDLIDKEDVQVTKNIVFGKIEQIRLHLLPMNERANAALKLESEISGGNLTVIQSALGTPWQIRPNNKIILFEDVGEAPYRIARMLQQLLANDFLQNAHAVILGDFINERSKPDADADGTQAAMDEVLQEFAERSPVPVLRYAGIGHGMRNFPIPLATPTQLILGADAMLSAVTGAAIKSHSLSS